MFQEISITTFNKAFKNEDDCKQYLFAMKWKDGYKCRRCGSTGSNKGKTSFHLRCKFCAYDESVTAHTMFIS
ncbi:MAG: transposase [Ferruginibacter sp.]|nr:transposase [Ferruginibacter sp.]